MRQRILLTFVLSLFSFIGFSQVDIIVPLGPDTTICDGSPLTLQAVTNGYVSHSVPTLSDDTYSASFPIGFSFNYYGNTYTNFVISSNGFLSFRTSLAGGSSPWDVSTSGAIPGNVNVKNSVCGVYTDLLFSSTAGTLTYGVAGVAPNRKLVVSFCNVPFYNCSAIRTSFQLILFETTNIIEIHTAKKQLCTTWPTGAPGVAIQGVEDLSGTVATASPGRNYPGTWTVTVPDGRRFTPDATLASYAVSTIPYNPIPASTATIYWYAGSSYIGTGASMTVNPTVNTTYTAAAVTCADTSKDMVNVIIGTGPSIVNIVHTDPTACGLCDGTLTIKGLDPGSSDTIKYYSGGVLQPIFIGVADGSGNLTISNICPGTYDNFTAKVGYCTSAPYGPVTVNIPPFYIGGATSVNPTVCGICNGSITITGLPTSTSDTIRFTRDGVLQPAIVLPVPASGIITVNNLCAGVYTNITVKMNYCIANVPDVTLTNPVFAIASTSFTNPTVCGICDGTLTINGLVPGYFDTVRLTRDGTALAPVVLYVPPTGTITVTGLCAGTYNPISVKMNSCTASTPTVTLTNPGFFTSGTTITHPTVCGVCDGSITINGLISGYSDTVRFVKDGVPQTPVVAFIGTAGTLTLNNLCAGNYTNIIVKMNSCTAPSISATLTNPAFFISSTSHTDPSVCGACDGRITINGLISGYSDTVRYIKDGIPQTPVVFIVPSSGTVVLTGLCAGTYTNLTVTMNSCTTPAAPTIMLINPAFGISDTASVNASCSACDGTFTLFGLTPLQTVTINYSYNGIPQPAYTTTTTAAGTVTRTGLCPGAYSNITATLNTCVSNPVGTIVISAPPLIPISIQSFTAPTDCGLCNGKIVIKGAPPGPIDSIFYSYNGAAQLPFLYSSGSDSTITLYNLCGATYSNFFIKVGPCPTTTIPTPITLVTPRIYASFDTIVHLGCASDVVSFLNTSHSDGAGALSYVWHFGDGSSDTATSPNHTYANQGTYNVTLIITNRFCVDSFNMTIVLDHPITAAFTSNTLACQKDSVSFTNNSAGAPGPLSYIWSFGDGTTSTEANPKHPFNNVGTYTVMLVSSNTIPCRDTAYTSIFVDSLSNLGITLSDTVFCRATYVTMNALHSSVGYTGIEWTFGDGDGVTNANPVVYAYHATGTFTVNATVSFRICPTLTASRTVTVLPQPNIYLGADTVICEGSESIVLADYLNAGTPSASWIWNTGATTYQVVAATPGTYAATVTVGNCSASDSVVIGADCYVSMPNIFSPNGDGINDYFYPRSLLSSGLTGFKMDIYNRWGQLIFTTNAVEGRGWDGKYNGEPQNEGVYIYIIDATFRDGKKEHHQGNLTLIK